MIHKVLLDGLTCRLGHQKGRIFSSCVVQHRHQRWKGHSLGKHGAHTSYQHQTAAPSTGAVLIKLSSFNGQPHQLICRNFSSQPPRLNSKQAFLRRNITKATGLSGLLGVILLSAIGLRYYTMVKRKADGAEEIVVEEYNFGQTAWLYRYRDYVLSSLVLDQLRERDTHNFDVREDDVWVVTFPKSGTTWLQEIVYLLMNDVDTEKASKMSIDLRFPYFEFMPPGIQAIVDMPSPRLIKSHLPFSLLPKQMESKKPKVIYIARNPKDVAVSFYVFAIKFLNLVPFNGNFEDFCRLFATDKVTYGPWWKHVSEAWRRKDEDNVLFLFYEDLQMDCHKCIRKIAEFLDKHVSDEQVEKIVKHCSFDSMKQNNSVNYEWLKDEGVAKKDLKFMRKGKVGDWKNHLSIDIVKQLDEMVATKLPPDMVGHIKDSLPHE